MRFFSPASPPGRAGRLLDGFAQWIEFAFLTAASTELMSVPAKPFCCSTCSASIVTPPGEVKRPVDSDWVKFKTPEAFEIQANCDYDIRTYGVAEYLCDYYKD